MDDFTYTLYDHSQRNKDLHFDDQLLKTIIEVRKPTSLLDIGAGVGWYCEAAVRLGVQKVIGIEKTPDIHQMEVFPVIVSDAAITKLDYGTIDVVLCLEVAQCIAPERVNGLVENCCRNSNFIVWSSAQPGQACPTGINLQPIQYWIEKFSKYGFIIDLEATEKLRLSAKVEWLKANICVFRPMKITLISPQRNELYMLPFFYKHYDNLVDQYVIYDNTSTDPQVFDLYKSNPKVRVETFDTGGKNSSVAKLNIRNNAYKSIISDWFIVCDIDEFIWHSNLRNYLADCHAKGITLPKISGYDMVSVERPTYDGTPLTSIIKRGIANPGYSKRAVFQGCVDICYKTGAHYCEPKGKVLESPIEEIKLLHYKWVGYEYAFEKMLERSRRLSPENIAHGWSFAEHDLIGGNNPQRWRDGFEKMIKESTQVI